MVKTPPPPPLPPPPHAEDTIAGSAHKSSFQGNTRPSLLSVTNHARSSNRHNPKVMDKRDIVLSLKALCRQCRRPVPSSPELHGFTFSAYSEPNATWIPCLIDVVRTEGGGLLVQLSLWKNAHDLDSFFVQRTSFDINDVSELELYTGSRMSLVLWHRESNCRRTAVGQLMLSTESGFALCFQSWVRRDQFVRLVHSHPSAHHICVVEDGERAPCARSGGSGPWSCVAYAVTLRSGHGSSGGKNAHIRLHIDKQRIEIILDTDNRAIESYELFGIHSGGFRCDPHPTERRALLICAPHMRRGKPRLQGHLKRNHLPSKAPYDVVFPSVAARERFLGRIRAVHLDVLKVDASNAKSQRKCKIEKQPSMKNLEFRKSLLDARTGLEQEKAMLRLLKGTARFTIFATSWNVGDTAVPSDAVLRGWLIPPSNAASAIHHDIIAIGLQECAVKHRESWLKSLEGVLDGDRVGDDAYTVVDIASMYEMHLIVAVRKSLAAFVCNVAHDAKACGIASVVGNKGAVASGFTFFDRTSIAFVNSHLNAGMAHADRREEDYSQICKTLPSLVAGGGVTGIANDDFKRPGGEKIGHIPSSLRVEFLHRFDHVVWLGDLNYRIDLGNHGTKHEFANVKAMCLMKRWSELLQGDQLLTLKKRQRIFCGFYEAPIAFAPTYRMVKNGPGYSNKKFQNPSYTDRILFRSAGNSVHGVSCGRRSRIDVISYGAHHEIPPVKGEGVHLQPMLQSDHRPVVGRLSLVPRTPFVNKLAPGRHINQNRVYVVVSKMTLLVWTESQAELEVSVGEHHPLFASFGSGDANSSSPSGSFAQNNSSRSLMALSGASDLSSSRGTPSGSTATSFSGDAEITCAACGQPIQFSSSEIISVGFDVVLCGVACEKFWRAAQAKGFDFKPNAGAQKVSLVNDSKPSHKPKHSRKNFSSILTGKHRVKHRPGNATHGLSSLKSGVHGKGIDRMVVRMSAPWCERSLTLPLKVVDALSSSFTEFDGTASNFKGAGSLHAFYPSAEYLEEESITFTVLRHHKQSTDVAMGYYNLPLRVTEPKWQRHDSQYSRESGGREGDDEGVFKSPPVNFSAPLMMHGQRVGTLCGSYRVCSQTIDTSDATGRVLEEVEPILTEQFAKLETTPAEDHLVKEVSAMHVVDYPESPAEEVAQESASSAASTPQATSPLTIDRRPSMCGAAFSHFHVKAISNFVPENESELRLDVAAGYPIIVLKTDESGWWLGRGNDGAEGWFPSNHVVRVEK